MIRHEDRPPFQELQESAIFIKNFNSWYRLNTSKGRLHEEKLLLFWILSKLPPTYQFKVHIIGILRNRRNRLLPPQKFTS